MSYTDWIPSFCEKMTDLKSKTCLEFGLGMGTTYLVDSFKCVYSVEINDNRKWFNDVSQTLKDRSNWIPMYFDVKDYGFGRTQMVRTKIMEKMLKEITTRIDISKIDVVFVDPACLQRWEVAQYFLDRKHPRVVIHDWLDQHSYGYQFISTPNHKADDYLVGCHTRHYILK